MRAKYLLLLFVLTSFGLVSRANAQRFSLGTAQNFAVLGNQSVKNTGPSVINGDVGVSPGNSATGFTAGVIVSPGVLHMADAAALQAHNDAVTSYAVLAGLTPTQNLTGLDLGGRVLLPGVYFFSSTAQLTGTLTLDTQGDPNALFVFRVGSALTTAPSSAVVTLSGGNADNVFWQVGTSATLDTATAFKGSLLASESISLNSGASITSGRALALNASVTLINNTLSRGNAPVVPGPAGTFAAEAAPEPGTIALLLTAGIPLVGLVRRRKKH